MKPSAETRQSKLSVIIPVYNGERFLRNTLKKIIRQTYKDYEVLLINDGSKDKSDEILKEFARSDDRCLVFAKENEGISKTRNYGIERAKGRYLIFLDQDDDFDELLFEDYVNAMESNDADMAIFGRCCTVKKEDGSIVKENFVLPGDGIIDTEEGYCDLILNADGRNRILTIWNCIYKAEIIKNQNIRFDSRFQFGYEDTLFNIEYACRTSAIFVSNKVHYHYVMRYGNSTITKTNFDMLRDVDYFCSKLDKRIMRFCAVRKFEIEIWKQYTELYIFKFFTKVYLRREFERFTEKRETVRQINSNTLFRNSCNLNACRGEKNRMYRCFLNVLCSSLNLSWITAGVFLLDLAKRKER